MRADTRTSAFGEVGAPTLVDRLGVWLSGRQIRRHVRSFAGLSIGDFGCGYEASFVRTVLDKIDGAVLVDVTLASDLKSLAKVRAIEGSLPDAMSGIASGSLDLVLCTSVLEHLWEPVETLREARRVTAPGGTCMFNVPTWRGKRLLEFSAFRLGLSPRSEMDDHKMYYDPRDLWPLLVRAGFVPHEIRCFRHKFGLNTFAACKIDPLATPLELP